MVWGGAKPPISSHGASPEARDPKSRQRGGVLGKGTQLQGLEGTLKLQDWTLTDEFAGLDIVGLDNPVFYSSVNVQSCNFSQIGLEERCKLPQRPLKVFLHCRGTRRPLLELVGGQVRGG